jgi:hypothetical protein
MGDYAGLMRVTTSVDYTTRQLSPDLILLVAISLLELPFELISAPVN